MPSETTIFSASSERKSSGAFKWTAMNGALGQGQEAPQLKRKSGRSLHGRGGRAVRARGMKQARRLFCDYLFLPRVDERDREAHRTVEGGGKKIKVSSESPSLARWTFPQDIRRLPSTPAHSDNVTAFRAERPGLDLPHPASPSQHSGIRSPLLTRASSFVTAQNGLSKGAIPFTSHGLWSSCPPAWLRLLMAVTADTEPVNANNNPHNKGFPTCSRTFVRIGF